MKLNGRWEGKLLDVSGPEALLTLDLKESDNKISGDFTVSFLSPGEGGCCGPVKRMGQVGPVSGKIDAQKGRIQFDYEITINLEPVAVSFEGLLTDADPHASQALIGCYSVGRGAGALTLDGGACVLWQFAQLKPLLKRKEEKNG